MTIDSWLKQDKRTPIWIPQQQDKLCRLHIRRNNNSICSLCCEMARKGLLPEGKVGVFYSTTGSTSGIGRHMVQEHGDDARVKKMYAAHYKNAKFVKKPVKKQVSKNKVFKEEPKVKPFDPKDLKKPLDPIKDEQLKEKIADFAALLKLDWELVFSKEYREVLYHLLPESKLDFPSEDELMEIFLTKHTSLYFSILCEE